MEELLTVLLFIGCPMALVQLLYRIVDHKGKYTTRLVKKFPVLVRRKFIIQLLVPLLFMVIFGVIGTVLGISLRTFFIVCGAVVGLINGLSVTIMYFCEENDSQS